MALRAAPQAVAIWLGAQALGALAACGGAGAAGAEQAAATTASTPEPGPGARPGFGSKPSVEERCDAWCGRQQACQQPGAAGCGAECRSRVTGEHAHQRGPFVWRLITCLEALECPAFDAGQPERACEEVARSQLDVSPALRRFCHESAARAGQCHQAADEADCLDRYRSLDDASLEVARQCLERPCAEVSGCFAQSFGWAAPAVR